MSKEGGGSRLAVFFDISSYIVFDSRFGCFYSDLISDSSFIQDFCEVMSVFCSFTAFELSTYNDNL